MPQPTDVEPSSDSTDWVQGPLCAELPDQTVFFLNHGADGVVIINFEGNLTAFRNSCLHQDMPIHAGFLARDGLLLCPWHNWCYDVKNGECLTAPGAYLEQYPVRVEDERVWVKLS